MSHPIPLADFQIGDKKKLTLITGPCVIENLDHAFKTCEFLKKLCDRVGINFIYKSSFDKANRSSLTSYRGPGLDKGLDILSKVKKAFDVPVYTDIHLPDQAEPVAEVCDCLQIPAFLCRQTDLLVAAAKTKAIIGVKKAQFMAPWDMKNVAQKLIDSGNDKIFFIDRGTSFGYNNLVSDMRSILIMQSLGHLVCFDATHSVQLPGSLGTSTGGQREFIAPLAKAALATGANLLYMESHDNPKEALCDATSVIGFDELETQLLFFKKLYDLVQNQ